MGSASALKPSSHALHCGSREQSLPRSVGSGLAFWKVALASDPGSPEGGGQLCIMFLPNAAHISPEDIPSLAFRRSSQDALRALVLDTGEHRVGSPSSQPETVAPSRSPTLTTESM